ncbi:hypothetical protein TeGR_g8879 [Tetraparma gracilis]|uniref:Uncharacterized protein n=1 Tax=Tetraparma gracilis TaxID=2962635 RepID=A0ABQ6M5P3_9STRA|nr:hypothetical protein TeGR_g8879 [Tetraparma gracilis]
MLWSIMFCLSGAVNMSMAWFFHFANDPSTSKAAMLGFAPNTVEATLALLKGLFKDPKLYEEIFGKTPPSLEFCSAYDHVTWAAVGSAGALYFYWGASGKRDAHVVNAFALMKLVTAGFLYVFAWKGTPGPLTVGIAHSDLVFGLLFFAHSFGAGGGAGNRKEKTA